MVLSVRGLVTDVEMKERKAVKELTVTFILSFAAILSKILSNDNERNVRNQYQYSIESAQHRKAGAVHVYIPDELCHQG
jgi:hypothetical protein